MTKKMILGLLLLIGAGQAFAQNNVRLPEAPQRVAYHDHTQLNDGFWIAIEAQGATSILFDSNKTNAQRAGLAVVAGYMFNEFLKIGVGMGGNCYVSNNQPMRSTSIAWNMPIYLDLRGNFGSQEVRNCVPYWSLDLGGAVKDGIFASPTIGLRFGEKRDSWLLGVTYSISQILNNKDLKYPEAVSFVGLKAGYEF